MSLAAGNAKKWSGLLGRGELSREPLVKVGATSQPLGFPAPLAGRAFTRPARGTGRAHRMTIRSTTEIQHWFKQLSHPHLLRSTAPLSIVAALRAPVQPPASAKFPGTSIFGWFLRLADSPKQRRALRPHFASPSPTD